MTAIYERYLHVSPHILCFYLSGFLFFPSSQLHNAFYYAVALLPLLPVAVRESWKLARSNWLFQIALIFVCYMCATSLWNPAFDSDDVLRSIKHSVLGVLYISLLSWQIRHNGTTLTTWLNASPALITIAATALALFWYQNHSFPDSRLFGQGLLKYPPHLGAICAFGFIVALGRLRVAQGPMLAGYGLSACILLLVIFLSQSLLAVISVSIGAASYLLFHRPGPKVTFAAIAVTAAIATFFYQFIAENILYETTGLSRFQIWKHVIDRSGDHWLFGHGLKANFDLEIYYPSYDVTKLLNRAHSVYLGCLYYGGIIGFGLSIAATASALLVLLNRARSGNNDMFLALMLLGATLVAGDWSHIIDHPNLLNLLYWLPFTIAIQYCFKGMRPPPDHRHTSRAQ